MMSVSFFADCYVNGDSQTAAVGTLVSVCPVTSLEYCVQLFCAIEYPPLNHCGRTLLSIPQ